MELRRDWRLKSGIEECVAAMVRIVITYELLQGKASLFERGFERIMEAAVKAAGNKGTGSEVKDKNALIYEMTTLWDSVSDFEAFVKSRDYRTASAVWGAKQVLLKQPSHLTYQDEQ